MDEDQIIDKLLYADTITPQERRVRVRWVTSYFSFFLILSLFDMGSDFFMMYTINVDQNRMQKFYDDNLEALANDPNTIFTDCTKTFEESCTSKCPSNDASIELGCGFCRAEGDWAALETTLAAEKKRFSRETIFNCNIDQFTENQQICHVLQNFEDQLEELNNIWIAYLVLICLSIFFTSYYFYQLYKKWRGKLSLIPMAHDGLIDPSTGLQVPYYAPPQEEWPGRVSAPTFIDYEAEKKKQAKIKKKEETHGTTTFIGLDEDIVVCPGCLERDRIGEVFCRVCGNRAGKTGIHGVSADRQKKKKELAVATEERQVRMKAYLSSFMSVAGTRMFMLMVEDMPQGLLAVLYVNTMDNKAGLTCAQNVYEFEQGDDLPLVGTSANRIALWILFVGQLCSLLLLMCQVLYIKGQQTKEQKLSYTSATFCGTDALLLFVIIPGVLCPVLIAFLVTDADLVLGVTDIPDTSGYTAFIVLIVLTAVFSLPWIGTALFGCFAFADITGIDSLCSAAYIGDGGGCCDCCDCCDTCGDLCDCCCC